MLRDELRALRRELKARVKRKLLAEPAASPPSTELTPAQQPGALAESGEEPPVVAQLVIEIRSDGSRTIARGALKDEVSGEQVALKAEGNTPLALAGKLAKSLLTAPLLARSLVRSAAPSGTPGEVKASGSAQCGELPKDAAAKPKTDKDDE